MRYRVVSAGLPTLSLEPYQPQVGVFHSLEAAASLTGVPRRSILVYCRAGLVRPVFQPPYGVMEFTDEAVFALRRLEEMRVVHGMDVSTLRTVAALLDEVKRLRAELRFLRGA